MDEMMTLTKTDLQTLESLAKRYVRFDLEIAIKKEELKLREEDQNIGGGKANIVGRPVEMQVIREQSSEFIVQRQKWKVGIETAFLLQTAEVQNILRAKLWGEERHLSWEEVGERHGMSKTTIYRVRYYFLQRFGEIIGYC